MSFSTDLRRRRESASVGLEEAQKNLWKMWNEAQERECQRSGAEAVGVRGGEGVVATSGRAFQPQ
jgi:hypothetical protein